MDQILGLTGQRSRSRMLETALYGRSYTVLGAACAVAYGTEEGVRGVRTPPIGI